MGNLYSRKNVTAQGEEKGREEKKGKKRRNEIETKSGNRRLIYHLRKN